MELATLSKIKPRQLKILQEAGIETIEALAMSVPGDLSDLDGISDKISKNLIWDARDTMQMTIFRQVSTLEENYEYLTTGSKNLDGLLGGGVSTGRITEVFGAFKSGKTNLSHSLCVTCQLPVEMGGLNGSVLFIDTENTFSKKKIIRIARRFGLDEDIVLSNIYHARIFSTDHQLQMVKAAEQAIKEKNARLIIVDSLMALMRSEYIGIGMLAARQQVLNKLIHDLSRIAETYNIAVLLTNQVATVMKGVFSANDAIGGNIVAHGCHFRLQFKAKGFQANDSLQRTATIVDAPDLPPESADFFITEAGISDNEKIEYPGETINEIHLFEDEGNSVLISAKDNQVDLNGREKEERLHKAKNLEKSIYDPLAELEEKIEENNLGYKPEDNSEVKTLEKKKITKKKSSVKK